MDKLEYAREQRRTLELDLVLDDQGLALGVDLLGELGRDGVMGSSVLDNKTGITLNSLVDSRLLNSPLADVGPFLIALHVLLGVRGLPPLVPAVGELLEERSLELCGLQCNCVSDRAKRRLTPSSARSSATDGQCGQGDINWKFGLYSR